MSGPLAKFIKKEVIPTYSIAKVDDCIQDILARRIVRLNQEIGQLEDIIRECTVEITALTRQKEKTLKNLDKAEVEVIMAKVREISKTLKVHVEETIQEEEI